MDTGQYDDLLNLLKAVADESRLRMVALMSERAYTVSEMATVFNLTEPTVSHHVSKLHGAGLLRLRMEGNQRFYRINDRESDGSGLGLAIVREFATRIGAMVQLDTPVDGAGLLVRVVFPVPRQSA